MSKSSSDKAYDSGYNAGKKGDMMDDFVHGNKDIIPGPNGRHEGSYDGGYNDGHKDRYSSDNSNYQGGNSGGSGGGGGSSDCFITTATLNSIGKPDDCEELNIFRSYRDFWFTKSSEGRHLITEYYNVAPKIVAAINMQSNHKEIYKNLWKKDIEPCLGLIKEHQYEKAESIYMNVVAKLKEQYL